MPRRVRAGLRDATARLGRVMTGLGIVVAAACGGDNSTGPVERDGTMTATISDTISWVANYSVAASFAGSGFNLDGVDTKGRRVRIQLLTVQMNPASPDTPIEVRLSLATASEAGFALYNEGTANQFSTAAAGTTGTIRFTHLSAARARGTFEFTASRPQTPGIPPGEGDFFRRISAGSFDVKLD